MKKDLPEYGCCALELIVAIAFVYLVVFFISEDKKVNKEKAHMEHVRDSIAIDSLIREKIHEDSIKAVMNSKEYKDSVEAAMEKENEEYLKNTTVIYLKDDSLYHYSTSCEWIEGCNDLRLISLGKALDMGLEECNECFERESIYNGYLAGEYISIEECEENNN